MPWDPVGESEVDAGAAAAEEEDASAIEARRSTAARRRARAEAPKSARNRLEGVETMVKV